MRSKSGAFRKVTSLVVTFLLIAETTVFAQLRVRGPVAAPARARVLSSHQPVPLETLAAELTERVIAHDAAEASAAVEAPAPAIASMKRLRDAPSSTAQPSP